jgi:SAM-dependent methyltransferase
MSNGQTLSPKHRRTALLALDRDRLSDLTETFKVEVEDRRKAENHVDALVRSKSVDFADLLAKLKREELQAICEALGLDSGGREKEKLIDRVLDLDSANSSAPKNSDNRSNQPKGRRRGAAKYEFEPLPLLEVRDRELPYEPLLRDDARPARPPAKSKKAQKPARRTGGATAVAAASGSIKAALRQFALGAAGGYRGRDARTSFTTHLLECFGWPDGRPEGAELPASFKIADAGERVEREVALWWPERRVLLEVAPHDADLGAFWKTLLRLCIQIDRGPQYVVLTNQREIQLYDLARDRETPRLSIPIDDLPRYSEAFPFFTKEWVPGTTPRIISVEKVSAEVADLIAKLHRSVRAQHPKREREVIRFTLQCITAMFAEDIGLLPKKLFVSLLYDGAKNKDIEHRLRDLFVQMNTPDLPEPRVVPYFNGGLFVDAVTLPLGDEQIIALTKAAEADWTYVDPHIFGSVFQGIMDDEERHAQGAHYTAHDDIMRVVGPTIVEPWRRRIEAAKSLKELSELRAELFRFRVLDPACGSGNFLYVAFREMYRLDTELLSRMRDFPSTHAKLSWNGAIEPTNFFGIDINPFAVELAKVTLNIAKKIAFEERKAQATALSGQVELDIDPSLPLDNLDQNIVCADALFTEWPEADAIVGNPPFVSGTNIKGELGAPYVARLREAFAEVKGRADYCSYWFRLAHDRLSEGGRAGLIGTSGIRVGNTREASLDYICANGGTITNAVSSQVWPGVAAVDVAMVNWVRGKIEGPYPLLVGSKVFFVDRIQTHLQLHADVSRTKDLAANVPRPTEGVQFGHEAFRFSLSSVPNEVARETSVLRPVATGDDLLRGRLPKAPDYCIDLRDADTEENAKVRGGAAFQYLRRELYPFIRDKADRPGEVDHYNAWIKYWWKPRLGRDDFFKAIDGWSRILVCPKVSSRPTFAFISTQFIAANTMWMFPFHDDYSFGVLQSAIHWEWLKAKGGRTREDFTITTAVWRTYPWPQDPTEDQVVSIAHAGRNLRCVRAELMNQNGWSLRQLLQSAEVEGPHPLKDAQAALDTAVRDGYGSPPDQDAISFLLELNQLVAEDEEQGRKVRGPGLPGNLDPKDPRFTSEDCIEPPAEDLRRLEHG